MKRLNGTLAEQMDEMEKKVLAHALKACGGNKSQTAKKLQISLRTLYYKLEKYNLVKTKNGIYVQATRGIHYIEQII